MGSRKRSIISPVIGPYLHRRSRSGGSDGVEYCFSWRYNSLVSVLPWLSPRQSVRPDCFFTCSRQNCLLSARLPAAIGFPVVILLLIPLRTIIIPRFPFTEEELAILDGPTASPFVSFLFDLGILPDHAHGCMRQWNLSVGRCELKNESRKNIGLSPESGCTGHSCIELSILLSHL